MFSVKGWNVSAPLKTQTVKDIPASEKPQSNNDAANKSKKRKRGAQDVSEANMPEMWERVVEGKDSASKAGSKKKQKQEKAPKANGNEEDEAAKGASEAVNGSGDAQSKKNKKEKKDKKKQKKEKQGNGESTGTTPAESASQLPAIPPAPPAISTPALTPLQASMRAKLTSARFRHLNETLYTQPSAKAQKLFTKNPDMFADYHAGFRQQVEVWPENPVDGYIRSILERGAIRGPGKDKKRDKKSKQPATKSDEDGSAAQTSEGQAPPVPGLPRTHGTSTIADLGCGDAALATALQPHAARLHLRLLAYDLHAATPLVTAADIAHLPLADGSVDVALFCLALMGTNWPDFIDEAWRVLRRGGELWVAEIRSRFGRVDRKARAAQLKQQDKKLGRAKKPKKRATGEDDEPAGDEDEVLAVEVDGQAPGQETEVGPFVEVLKKHGFVLAREVDASNKMFVKMTFVKAGVPIRGKNAKPEEEDQQRSQPKWKKPKAKFIEEEAEDDADEAKVLKPCVYKLR
jgi:ribosomal RNA-processing protein 8